MLCFHASTCASTSKPRSLSRIVEYKKFLTFVGNKRVRILEAPSSIALVVSSKPRRRCTQFVFAKHIANPKMTLNNSHQDLQESSSFFDKCDCCDNIRANSTVPRQVKFLETGG